MLNFRKAEIGDREKIVALLKKSQCPSLEYNFTTFFLWQEQFNMEFAISEDVLYVRAGKNDKSYLFPCGTGDIEKALDILLSEKVRFHSLTPEQREFLEKKAPERFEFTQPRDDNDYVYLAECLKTLSGKKLSSKRNHINKFVSENPDWKYEKITNKNIDEVKEMHRIWCENCGCDKEKSLDDETIAVKKALEFFNELNLSGGLIRTKGRVVAFSIGDELSSDTFLVHIEKAYSEFQGAYQLINREFVINNCDGYEYVNREDDAGDEGLRKAKLSYKPHKILTKFIAREKA